MTHPPRAILLIGLRGAGKTSVARSLARRVAGGAIDLDDVTLSLMGVPSVRRAWEEQGEPAFRLAERRALQRVLDEARSADVPIVISAGGGTPTAPGAADVIRRAQAEDLLAVVYLRNEPSLLARRVRNDDDHRPALLGTDVAREMDAVHAQRDPLFLELADHVIENAPSVEQAAMDVGAWAGWAQAASE